MLPDYTHGARRKAHWFGSRTIDRVALHHSTVDFRLSGRGSFRAVVESSTPGTKKPNLPSWMTSIRRWWTVRLVRSSKLRKKLAFDWLIALREAGWQQRVAAKGAFSTSFIVDMNVINFGHLDQQREGLFLFPGKRHKLHINCCSSKALAVRLWFSFYRHLFRWLI